MTFRTVVSKNEKALFLALVALVLIETAFAAIWAYKGIIQVYNIDYIYHVSYIILWMFWAAARCEGLNASFDKGLFYWFVYPFFIFYSCLKQYGWLKGTGVFFIFFFGLLLPDIVYNVIFMMIVLSSHENLK